jgi:glutathione synthase/RimK-type ligase-like ATP-grasp enzyme
MCNVSQGLAQTRNRCCCSVTLHKKRATRLPLPALLTYTHTTSPELSGAADLGRLPWTRKLRRRSQSHCASTYQPLLKIGAYWGIPTRHGHGSRRGIFPRRISKSTLPEGILLPVRLTADNGTTANSIEIPPSISIIQQRAGGSGGTPWLAFASWLHRMILIFSDTTDVHADAVAKSALLKNTEVCRLNRDEVHRWSLDFLRGEPLVTFDGNTFSFDKIRSLLIRRLPDPESFKSIPTNAPPEARDYIALQRFTQTSDCIALLSECKPAINSLASAQRSQSKATQLSVADRLGLCTPNTYSGTNSVLAREHITGIMRSGGRACTKPIANTYLTLGGQKHTRFTELLDESELATLNTLSECPLTIQEYIEKAYELRVTIVGDRVFACKIESQSAGGTTAVDWRRYNIPRTPHSRYELPATLQQQLLAFHTYFGLTASSFDIIRSREGKYVFLESNPYGQWLWIEDLTGLPITAAITDFLLQQEN